jgi:hypothetical protein
LAVAIGPIQIAYVAARIDFTATPKEVWIPPMGVS